MQRFPSYPAASWLKPFVATVATISAVLVIALPAGAQAPETPGSPPNDAHAAALVTKHAELSPQLAKSPFRRPLLLESSENASMTSGDAYAVLDSPFNTVTATFKSPSRWCEVMMLHLNTKFCKANGDSNPATLKMNVGRKAEQPLKDTYALEFTSRLLAASPQYLGVQLNAAQGPLGTSNYRIELQAVPLPEGKTFMHLRYSYGYGVASRLAMQGYLATVGSEKVGFTQIARGSGSAYVAGMRGTVERNTMRYYLAIEAYLATLDRPAPQQLEARLKYWFDATEEYPRQLHELDRNTYLSMKRDEYQRLLGATPG